MKIHMTFDLNDRHRKAIARMMGCRRPATRTQAVQWLSAMEQAAVEHALRELRRWEVDPDPDQLKFDSLKPPAEPAEERKTA